MPRFIMGIDITFILYYNLYIASYVLVVFLVLVLGNLPIKITESLANRSYWLTEYPI